MNEIISSFFCKVEIKVIAWLFRRNKGHSKGESENEGH